MHFLVLLFISIMVIINGTALSFVPQCLIKHTENKKQIYQACFGIPFAEPPIGDLRFRDPNINKNWFQNLNYSKEKPSCLGLDLKGSEDCLYLNIFIPTLHKNDLKTVIVWVPGQFFTSADTTFDSNGPDYFIEEGVIFVTLSYRQGIFGFVSTGDLQASGNIGIKDIATGLKWIQKNIQYFKGDPRKVTIMGHGSGAVCISILQKNPVSQGLFQRLILQSGSSLVSWGRSFKSRAFIFKLGDELHLDTTNSTTLMTDLRKYENLPFLQKTVKRLYKYIQKHINPLHGSIIGPVLETPHHSAIFTSSAHESLLKGEFTRVPIILGYTSLEGVADKIQYISGSIEEKPNKHFYPTSIKADYEKHNLIGTCVKNYYFHSNSKTSFIKNMKFVSEDIFIRPILETARLISNYVPVYLYEFSHLGLFEEQMAYPGVGHEAELPYIFKSYKDYPKIPVNDSIRISMIKFLTNFAKYGNPTPKLDEGNFTWLRLNEIDGNIVYASIDHINTLKLNPCELNMRFYDELFDKYGNPPFDTF